MKNQKQEKPELPFSVVGGVPDGYRGFFLGQQARDKKIVLYVAVQDADMAAVRDQVRFYGPDVEVIAIPAWDGLPYDRVSPRVDLVGERLQALGRLQGLSAQPANHPVVIITTVNAMLQYVPPKSFFHSSVRVLRQGEEISQHDWTHFFVHHGYHRMETVHGVGEFAIRGDLMDVFPTGCENPVRLDLFGNRVERIRVFDALTQRTIGEQKEIVFSPANEVMFTDENVQRFREKYRSLFGADGVQDPLYESITAKRPFDGMEHWMPLFYEKMASLFDYVPSPHVFFADDVMVTVRERCDQVLDYYQARQDHIEQDAYRPLPPDYLYISDQVLHNILAKLQVTQLSVTAGDGSDQGGRMLVEFSSARANTNTNIHDFTVELIRQEQVQNRKVMIACYSAGSADRLGRVLKEHGLDLTVVEKWTNSISATIAVVPMEHGFRVSDFTVITEQDILGDRLSQPPRKKQKAKDFIAEASALSPGDLVVHVEHGVGQFQQLEMLDVNGIKHDFALLIYQGGDKLYVPVENIEVLSRYGSADEPLNLLDKLGGAGWQSRKARVKKRLRDIADQLMKVAAARILKQGMIMTPPPEYDEFCARFPYTETDDQLQSIEDTLADLASGKVMDRLVCGDVGFGKTEVALRAAFVAAMNGYQVAIIAPTTLLARQHFDTFTKRFAGLPVRVESLSRFVPAAKAKQVKQNMENHQVDIVIGTHALLAKDVKFKNLGLMVVDEEQRFGVQQKERLKNLRADVHVLTLTATPIPRTLQLSLSGVKDMSVMATPPVDRLAVRTFVLPYDGVVLREAMLREYHRGGQIFYVCPRISDLHEVAEKLQKLVPDLKVGMAHGQMSPTELDRVMTAFCDRHYDLLLSTHIIESGLDIPSANTMIIHRADRFGLAQLYQLRGRVGRSKVRAYAYLTTSSRQQTTEIAQKRLAVMQTLDRLGAGFTLASHDLDIRGGGNLLGEEQSGHIKEVGVELYQHMLAEAIARAREEKEDAGENDLFVPQINLGTAVLIPENYVADLTVRLQLYRRIASLTDKRDMEALAAEMVDRFGALPDEVENLLQVVEIKQMCKLCQIEKLEAGPKGAVLWFYQNRFANPGGLVDYMSKQSGTIKLRPQDHALVLMRDWRDPVQRMQGLHKELHHLAKLAQDV